nr:MAG TPA: hypothetical protein [Caudoviricetes sp.]
MDLLYILYFIKNVKGLIRVPYSKNLIRTWNIRIIESHWFKYRFY